MADCPTCEYHKQRAQIWRDEAYRLAGHPLPERDPVLEERDPVLEEREACAKVCEDSNTWDLYDPNGFAANLIRARGQA